MLRSSQNQSKTAALNHAYYQKNINDQTKHHYPLHAIWTLESNLTAAAKWSLSVWKTKSLGVRSWLCDDSWQSVMIMQCNDEPLIPSLWARVSGPGLWPGWPAPGDWVHSLSLRADQPLSSPGHLTSSCCLASLTGMEDSRAARGRSEPSEAGPGLSPEIAESAPTASQPHIGAAAIVSIVIVSLRGPLVTSTQAGDWWPLVTHSWPGRTLWNTERGSRSFHVSGQSQTLPGSFEQPSMKCILWKVKAILEIQSVQFMLRPGKVHTSHVTYASLSCACCFDGELRMRLAVK